MSAPIKSLREDILACIEVGSVPYISGPPGVGKCLGRGTPVLMFDGSIRAVESVQVDDLLMGPDSRPRKVLSLARGREEMYRVTPVKGDSYVVNKSHILSLKMSPERPGDPRELVNISVPDYLAATNTFRHHAKGWRTPVSWPEKDIPAPAYILGMWLGNGYVDAPAITTAEPEVVEELNRYADATGMTLKVDADAGKAKVYRLSTGQGPGLPRVRNDLVQALRCLNLYETREKFIPDPYKINCREVQLELLAGVIDADGYLSNGCWDMTLKSKSLVEGVCFVARSLGLAAYFKPCRKECVNTGVWGDYFRITISGDLSMVPCRVPRRIAPPRNQIKDPLVTGISLESIGVDDYFGFEIDGDRLFVLGDFTVTHNTRCMESIAKEIGGMFVTVIGSQCEATDINGFPVVVSIDGSLPSLKFAPRQAFLELKERGGLLFFDELTSSPPSVQSAMLRGLCDWVFGDLEFDRDKVAIGCAGNPAEIAVNGQELGEPVQNRLEHFEFPTGPEARTEWCVDFPGYWGQQPRISFKGRALSTDALLRARSFVSGFIYRKPEMWLDPRFEQDEGKKRRSGAGRKDQASPAYCTPRSWDRVSHHVAWCLDRNLSPMKAIRRIAAAIGQGPAAEFEAYLRTTALPDPEELLANPDKFKPSGQLDVDFATTMSVVSAFESKLSLKRCVAAWKVVNVAVSKRGNDGSAAYEAGMAAAMKLAAYTDGANLTKMRGSASAEEVADAARQIHAISKPFLNLVSKMIQETR